jgi:hypothetical protein
MRAQLLVDEETERYNPDLSWLNETRKSKTGNDMIKNIIVTCQEK